MNENHPSNGYTSYEDTQRSIRSPFEYAFLTSPEDRENIICDIEDFYYHLEENPHQHLFFLDQSARPIAWAMQAVFKELGQELPQIHFVNIGTELEKVFQEKVGEYSYKTATNEEDDVYRKKIVAHPFIGQLKETFTPFIAANESILIVDDWIYEGTTAFTADVMLSEAFDREEVDVHPVFCRYEPSWRNWIDSEDNPEFPLLIRSKTGQTRKRQRQRIAEAKGLNPEESKKMFLRDLTEDENNPVDSEEMTVTFRHDMQLIGTAVAERIRMQRNLTQS